MQTEITISIQPSDEHNIAVLQKKAARELFRTYGKISPEKINIAIIKKSIDARKRPIKLVLRCRVSVGEDFSASASYSASSEASASESSFASAGDNDYTSSIPSWKNADEKHSVIIVGAGPAGMFAALRLLEDGIKPIIIERGAPTSERRRDIAAISTKGIVDSDSNYCFGEGGAGMFSDGKLYTRSNKRGNISRILQTFVHFGASESILTDAHPHIGTDKLPQVVDALCAKITECGGEIFYNTRCTNFLCDRNRIVGIATQNTRTGEAREFFADKVILATGHSASDIYKLLARTAPAALEAKTFAAGVRVEHPRELIDSIQYHGQHLQQKLPTAEYRLTSQIDGRGVYSFCMCPGGFVVPSSTAPEQIVINGMSTAKRNSRWSNAAIVVEIRPEDIPVEFQKLASRKNCPALAGLYFREWLEQDTFLQVKAALANAPAAVANTPAPLAEASSIKDGSQQAPAQRLTDFLSHKKSASLPSTSYAPGIISSRIDEWLYPHIATRLSKAFKIFDKKMHGFVTKDALIIASETRTSTPVRIVRDKETLECVALKNLYPCGEGSGYAGGITSSAMDGINVAERIANILQENKS